MTEHVIKHLTPRGLAERWGCAVASLANDRSRGTGPAFLKIGGKVVYTVADVEAYEAARRVEPVSA